MKMIYYEEPTISHTVKHEHESVATYHHLLLK